MHPSLPKPIKVQGPLALLCHIISYQVDSQNSLSFHHFQTIPYRNTITSIKLKSMDHGSPSQFSPYHHSIECLFQNIHINHPCYRLPGRIISPTPKPSRHPCRGSVPCRRRATHRPPGWGEDDLGNQGA